MKIQVNTQECLYIEINGWTYYIDDSTNEQIIDKWINTSDTNYKFNKKFIKGSFFRSLPFSVQNSFKYASKFYKGSYDIDFCNVSESDGIKFISRNIDYLRRFPKIGNKRIIIIKECLEKWKESHQEEITQKDMPIFEGTWDELNSFVEKEYDPNKISEMEANEGRAIKEYEKERGNNV